MSWLHLGWSSRSRAGDPRRSPTVRRRRAAPVTLVLILLAHDATVDAQQAAPLRVDAAVPDAAAGTLTISGQGFGPGPLVTLDLVPLAIQSAGDAEIVASVPVSQMPVRQYLLTVSRGPAAGEHATVSVTLGADVTAGAKSGSDAPEPAAAVETTRAADTVVARVGDRALTLADVDREWQRADPGGYLGLSRQLYDRRRAAVDRLVGDELIAREAKARGLTVEALLADEIPKRIVSMPESAVATLYQSLGPNTRGATLDEMRPALRSWLERFTEPELARMSYLEELMRVSTRVEMLLAPPRVRVERAAQDAALGPSTAAVEIVAFGDLQSPSYARFAGAFGKTRETFGDRLRFVFKHLPAGEPESVTAAEALQCANAQGQFWAYHDALLPYAGVITTPRLKLSASVLGLDRNVFDACVDSGEYRGLIREALDEAARYGIAESPSFLVNGRLAPPAPGFLPPFEFFTRVIEEELFRQSREAAQPNR